MWVPEKVISLIGFVKDSVDKLREDNAILKSENASLRGELLTTKANFDWLRVRVNALEVERAALLEKVSGVRIPVPEVVRHIPTEQLINQFTFEDVGDDVAKKLGLPVYGD